MTKRIKRKNSRKKRTRQAFAKIFGSAGVISLIISILIYKFHNYGWLGTLISEFAIVGIIAIITAIVFVYTGKKIN